MERLVSKEAIKRYFTGLHRRCKITGLMPLGRGAHGQGFLLTLTTGKKEKTYVLKTVRAEGLGHDYPSDRASMFLLALDTYSALPCHVKAVNVLSIQKDGSVRSIGGGREYMLLMEQAEGTSYFKDLSEFSKKERLDAADKKKITSMARYLKRIHSVKKSSKHLYLRKLRDIIGHGECLMGVFDTYPEGTLSYREMAEIEKKCIDWRARLKDGHGRLCRIHGDFHPGNIWFREVSAFMLLDRSRGPWGEPADDLTALSINYVFFSIKHHGSIKGAYLEGLRFFFDEYIGLTGDTEVLEVSAPFFAFRGAVVANPVFYPEVSRSERRLIFKFVHGVLDSKRFQPEKANEYLKVRR